MPKAVTCGSGAQGRNTPTLEAQYSQISSSFVVVHVSEEPVWLGTRIRSHRNSPLTMKLPTREGSHGGMVSGR